MAKLSDWGQSCPEPGLFMRLRAFAGARLSGLHTSSRVGFLALSKCPELAEFGPSVEPGGLKVVNNAG